MGYLLVALIIALAGCTGGAATPKPSATDNPFDGLSVVPVAAPFASLLTGR